MSCLTWDIHWLCENFEEQKKFGSQSSDVGMNTPDRTEKAGENGGKEVFMEFVHKIW